MRLPIVVAIAMLLAPAALHAQDTIHTLVGTGSGGLPGFGYSVAAAGDIDPDGVGDIVVGAPYEGPGSGRALVHSGSTGSVLFTLTNAAAGQYGVSVGGIGDVNGDGRDDIVVGDPQPGGLGPGGKGQAQVWSGLNGSSLFLVTGDQAGDEFGYSVGAAGDVNGDGFPDWIVGATEGFGFNPGGGYARVYSGFDGALLLNLKSGGTASRFGQSVVGVGRRQRRWKRRHLDQCVAFGPGQVQARSGANGGLLWSAIGSAGSSKFGWDVDFAGDVDGDGAGDVVIGAFGYFDVRRAATGFLVKKVPGATNAFFGGAVAGVSDVDGDGHDDLLIGSKFGGSQGTLFAGRACVYSGRTLGVMREFAGSQGGDHLGFSTAGVGDIDQDALPDVAISADQDGNMGPGFVRLEKGRPSLVGDAPVISLSSGGAQVFSIDAGLAFGGDGYILLGSLSGTAPGVPLGPFTIPLVSDPWFAWTFTQPNTPPLSGSFGLLSNLGAGVAALTLPAGVNPAFAGISLNHALLTFRPGTSLITGVSLPVALTLVP